MKHILKIDMFKPLEIETRKWEEFEDSVAEDSVQGKWHYVPILKIINAMLEIPLVYVEECAEGIKLIDFEFGDKNDKNPYYLLSGRRPDWVYNGNRLCDFEVIRKTDSVTECSGRELKFPSLRYINYGALGLMTPEHGVLVEEDLIRTAGIFTILKYTVDKLIK